VRFSSRVFAVAVEVAIIVTDVPPLITLAAAQSLDYLLYADLPVVIPDAVFYEATRAVPAQRESPSRHNGTRLLRCARNDRPFLSLRGARQRSNLVP
jgi:hypothetical protein